LLSGHRYLGIAALAHVGLQDLVILEGRKKLCGISYVASAMSSVDPTSVVSPAM
jgi:hypothetical protein